MDNGTVLPDRRQGDGMRLLPLLAVLAVLAVPPAAADGAAPRSPDLRRALTVLHGWDEQRAAAWAGVDETALEALYVPGSAAARADVRLLRSYAARGVVVRRLVTQVFGVRVLAVSGDRISLRVLDRVAGGVAVDHGRALPLASSPPAVRRIDLVLHEGSWRVRAVSGSG